MIISFFGLFFTGCNQNTDKCSLETTDTNNQTDTDNQEKSVKYAIHYILNGRTNHADKLMTFLHLLKI